jgi:beta-glucanase (GH16 family)
MKKTGLSVKHAATAAAFLGFVFFFSPAVSQAQSLSGWNLVWSDEFNGASLDTNKWMLELHEGDPGLAVYTGRPQNLFVQNGCLVLQVQKESYSGKQYTSTQISTRKSAAWKYCRIDVRAKLPRSTWPAIWMMPPAPAYGGWPASGEIDIMENWGGNTATTTIHYSTSNQQNAGSTDAALSASFHVYTMIWDSGSFKFYLDSYNYFNLNSWSPNNVSYPKPFDQPFFLMFDLALSYAPDTTPKQFLVDWVHVYQRQGTTGVLDPAERHPATGFCVRATGNLLSYSLDKGANIKIGLCDAMGRKVFSLVNGYQDAGRHDFDITGRVGKGVYMCTFENGTIKEAQRIVFK